MSANENKLVVTFRTNTMVDEAASKARGRPIFVDQEIVEIRFPGNKQTVAVFPAHDFEPEATRNARAEGKEPVTYAMLYNEQYRRFKAGEAQGVTGTPLSEMASLPEAKRRELKALNIHTVEALAGLDGQPLKQLGMGGRDLKNQAQAHLKSMSESVDVTALAATVRSLQEQLAQRDELIANYATKPKKTAYQKGVEKQVNEQLEAEAEAQQDREEQEAAEAEEMAAVDDELPQDGDLAFRPSDSGEEGTKPLDDFTDAELKAYIKSETGEPVRGNPKRETLLDAARELAAGAPEA